MALPSHLKAGIAAWNKHCNKAAPIFQRSKVWSMARIRSLGSLPFAVSLALLYGCGSTAQLPEEAGYGPNPTLPEPPFTLLPTVQVAPAVGWPDNAKPLAPDGLEVIAFARDLSHPRWLHVLPNGDVLVAESNKPQTGSEASGFSIRGWMAGRVMRKAGAAVPSADRITLLRDTDGDGVADERHIFIADLHSPFGMTYMDDHLYVANTDALLRFPYREGVNQISGGGETLLRLPAGPLNYHWTKNLIADLQQGQLYISVGSNSNIAEHGLEAERGRAAIWQFTPANGEGRIYATGLRNPVGMTWVPETRQLWVAVNERDELGSDLVPDYMTVVREDGFYGWPYSYYGQHLDKRVKQDEEKVAAAIVPDYALGAHSASLGLVYSDNQDSLQLFGAGMFVGQHGSWNRKPPAGYRVIFIPFQKGQPAGMPQEVLTGFLNDRGEAMGRPVGVTFDKSGDLLVADDVGNTVWRVRGTDRPGLPLSSHHIWRVAERR